MEYQVNNDSLMHYGVPGMKWGVRHDKPSSGSSNRRSGMSNQTKQRIKNVAGTAAKVGLVVGVGMAMRNPAVRNFARNGGKAVMHTVSQLGDRKVEDLVSFSKYGRQTVTRFIH